MIPGPTIAEMIADPLGAVPWLFVYYVATLFVCLGTGALFSLAYNEARWKGVLFLLAAPITFPVSLAMITLNNMFFNENGEFGGFLLVLFYIACGCAYFWFIAQFSPRW